MSNNDNMLVDRIVEIFTKFGIVCYKIENRNIRLENINPNFPAGENLEFDIIGRFEDKYGFIIEATTREKITNIKRKMNKFVKHCNIFNASLTNIRNRLNILDIKDDNSIRAFENIFRNQKIKSILIATSPQMIINKISTKQRIPSDGNIPSDPNLYVFNSEHLQYLEFLSNTIGKYGRYELFAALDISPRDIETTLHNIPIDNFIKLSGKNISKKIDSPADIYIFTLNVYDLLIMSKVSRYGSLDSNIPEEGSGYQRLLKEEKLKSIREFINKFGHMATFPNAIITILHEEPRIGNNSDVLELPVKYGSIEIIDGQHRLFAFAKSNLNEDKLRNTELIVIGIRFVNDDVNKIKQWAARTFVDINKEQAKVPTDLIYLISYKAMGETHPKALAARVLMELNVKGPLAHKIGTRPHTKDKAKTIKITTVVNKLQGLFNKKLYKNIFSEMAVEEYENNNPEPLIKEAHNILEIFFSQVKAVFNKDWENEEDSLILTSKYTAAFCKLFIEIMKNSGIKIKYDGEQISNHKDLEKYIKEQLEDIKNNIIKELKMPNEEIIFKRDAKNIPQVSGKAKSDVETIYNFIKDPKSYLK